MTIQLCYNNNNSTRSFHVLFFIVISRKHFVSLICRLSFHNCSRVRNEKYFKCAYYLRRVCLSSSRVTTRELVKRFLRNVVLKFLLEVVNTFHIQWKSPFAARKEFVRMKHLEQVVELNEVAFYKLSYLISLSLWSYEF